MNIKMQLKWMEENETRRKKWEYMTEGIKDNFRRKLIEQTLEQTEQYLLEETTTGDIGYQTTFVYPLIRRHYLDLIAPELVSIQPIPQATGKIFFFGAKYGTTRTPTTAEDRADMENYGTSGKFNQYYGIGVRDEPATGTVNSSNTTFTSTYYPWIEADLVVRVDGVAVSVASATPATGTYVLSVAPTTGSTVTHDYNLDHEGNDLAGEIDAEMTSLSVEAIERRLKAKWTIEAQMDAQSYHKIDLQSELMNFMQQQISAEKDREIISALYALAGSNVTWVSGYDPSSGQPGEGYSRKEYDETFIKAINAASNMIYKKRSVNGNFIVASPDDCERMENISGWRYINDDMAKGGDIVEGLHLFGTIRSKYKVYKDPLATVGSVLVGHKNTSWMKTGFVHSPYVPIYASPVIIDTDFKPRRAIMSRYANKGISGDFYATVTVA